MPILTLHYRNQNPTGSPSTDDDKYARQKLRMSSLSVPIQKLTLVGYCINLRKFDGTLNAGKSHQIPDHILVEIPEFTTQSVNNVSPPKTHNGDDYVQTHSIPLPLTDNLNTIHFGMNLDFEVNKRLNRELTIHLKKFNEDNEIVSMTTSTNADGQVAVDHVLLYFNYSSLGKF